jgi:hypothetical protein
MRRIELVPLYLSPLIVKHVITENADVLMRSLFAGFSDHTVHCRFVNSIP